MQNKKLLAKSLIIGVVVALLVSIILLCIVSAIILSSGLLSSDITTIVSIAVLSAGVFAGGFLSAKITKSAGLIVGAITGFTVFLLITITGLIKSSDTITFITLVRFAVSLLFGAFGGIVAVNKKERIKIK